MKDFILLSAGAAISAIGFLLQRTMTKARIHEEVDLKSRFLEAVGLADVDGDIAKLKPDMDVSEAISPGGVEETLVRVLREDGPVLSWEKFQALSMARGINPISNLRVEIASDLASRARCVCAGRRAGAARRSGRDCGRGDGRAQTRGMGLAAAWNAMVRNPAQHDRAHRRTYVYPVVCVRVR